MSALGDVLRGWHCRAPLSVALLLSVSAVAVQVFQSTVDTPPFDSEHFGFGSKSESVTCAASEILWLLLFVGGAVGCASVTKVLAHPHLMQEKFGPHFPCGSYSAVVEVVVVVVLPVV